MILRTLALSLPVAVLSQVSGLSAETESPDIAAYAVADRFEAIKDTGGAVCVIWHTTVELCVGGYRVLRKPDDGAAQTVGVGWTPSQGNDEGGTYGLADPAANSGGTLRYELWTVDKGQPGQLVASWQGVPAVRQQMPEHSLSTRAATLPEPAPMALQAWVGTGSRVRAWTDSEPASRVRVSLREEGVYRVTAQELAVAMGVDASTMADAMACTNLAVSCQDQPVAWLGEGTNLYFYGLPAASRYAPENVYWVSFGRGAAMSADASALPVPATSNARFVDTVERVGTTYLARVSYSSLADAPAPYVGFLPLMNGGGSFQNNESLADPAPGVWTGTVTVNLLSYNESGIDNHRARVSVGGTVVGESGWLGEKCVSHAYAFSSTNLSGSTAALMIENSLDANVVTYDNTRFFCFSYRFAYPRLYRARCDALRCTGGDSNTVAVTGFAANDILALDVTDPAQPALAAPLTVAWNADAGKWAASFPCGGTDRVYAVCSRCAVKLPAVRGVRDVDWTAACNGMDYAILIPPEAWRSGFREAMQPLAEYRTRQGLRTQVVDVESVYNRFSHGLVDPEAIRAFCRAGRAWASRPLKYMLLAGAGALDFKQQRLGVSDYTACLIPTVILGQSFAGVSIGMTVSADQAFGDVDGDNVPEVVVGRLPTTKTQELAIAVQKTISYEDGLSWQRPSLVAADWDNTGDKNYSFSAGTDRILGPLARAGKTAVKLYPVDNTGNLAPVRVNGLFPGLSAGSSLFHFFGHTDELNLGGGSGKLLTSPAHISSANWQKPVLAVIMGCRANRWQSLTTTVCILPYGLFAANTGFVASLGSTGNMVASEAEDFAVQLYTGADGQGVMRLGDVLLRGMRRMVGAVPAERILCYSLIGDPALVFDDTPPYGGTAILLQ